MNDYRTRDRNLLIREFFSATFLSQTVIAIALFYFLHDAVHAPGRYAIVIPIAVFTQGCFAAHKRAAGKRFHLSRFALLWEACEDRLNRFERVLKLAKGKVAELSEMPNTIRNVSLTLYAALRRADAVEYQLSVTESMPHASNWKATTTDKESLSMYQIADKNIAEYQQRHMKLLNGVHRTEAQAAVFMTTVDAIRMKMLSYRLIDDRQGEGAKEMVASLAEAKLQLDAIDKALEELDLGLPNKAVMDMPPLPEVKVEQAQETETQ